MGVHIAGGYPNIGSVIGPAGNIFGEYILALAVFSGESSVRATKVDLKTRVNLSAPSFSLVRVEPEALKKGAESTTDLNGYKFASDNFAGDESEDGDIDEDKDSEDGHGDGKSVPVSGGGKSLLDKQIDSLWGFHPAKHSKQFNQPFVMHFPERLEIEGPEDQVTAPKTDQIIDAAKKAIDHPDVQTVFFANFPPGGLLNPTGTKELKKLMGLVQTWQVWSSSVCEANVQHQINNKALSADAKGQFARSTYRAKVFDYLFRQVKW